MLSDETAPRERALFARSMLFQALLLGIAADALLRRPPWGIALPLWMAQLALSVVVLARYRDIAMRREQHFWIATVMVCASMFALRDAESVQLLSLGVAIFALAMLAMSLSARPAAGILDARIRDVIWGFFQAARDAVGGIVPLTFREAALGEVARGTASRQRVLIRSLAITLPLVLIFGVLFVHGDPMFAAMLSLPTLDAEEVVSHVVVAGLFTWVTAGWMRGALIAGTHRSAPPDAAPFRLGSQEITMALGALSALFALFVFAQLRWFFGGAAVVLTTTGLSVAEYARRGFFELLWVSLLVFPLLLGTRAAAEGDVAALRRHSVLAVLLLCLLAMIMASAMFRMRLYVEHFGLTEDRLYASTLMLWLAVVFFALARTMLRGWTRPFAAFTVVSGVAAVVVMGFANPNAIVARVNLSRVQSAGTRPIDYPYLASLSADAVPTVVPAIATAPRSDGACRAARTLWRRWSPYGGDWRQWNLAAHRARSIVRTDLKVDVVRRLCHSAPDATPSP